MQISNFLFFTMLFPKKNPRKGEKKSQKSPIKSPQNISPGSRTAPKIGLPPSSDFLGTHGSTDNPGNRLPSTGRNISVHKFPPPVSQSYSSHNLNQPPPPPSMISPPKITISEPHLDSSLTRPQFSRSFQMPKPCFKDDVAELSRRLDSLKMKHPKAIHPKTEQPHMPDSLFDSGNSSPDDFSFNSDSFRASTSKSQTRSNQNFENEIYPFGSVHLCLPKTNLSRISRCSSFNSEESFANSDNFPRFF